MYRIVIDTNVIVSRLLSEYSTPGKAYQLAVKNHIVLLSNEVFNEYVDTVLRKKFDKYFDREDTLEFLNRLAIEVKLINPVHKITACRDANDNKFLELAIAGNADYIITGDPDLLVLNPFQSVQILTPAVFLEANP